MPKYIARVELHNVTNPFTYAYTLLHANMSDIGFNRTITADDGKSYHLPPGEYCGTSTDSLLNVRDRVFQVARNTGYNASVLVTQYEICAWAGLKEVDSTLNFLAYLAKPTLSLNPFSPYPKN